MNGESPSYSRPFDLTSTYHNSLPAHRHSLCSTPHADGSSNTTLESAKFALMPQRKHHKLLKDGSGNEVWPEFVEQIFVNGLRAYTASTVSQNHTTKLSDAAVPGRSRLRNAFLVQYLTERGIKRSRKQVASHLQVLKNMWRADGNYSDYRLVVGPDFLPQTQPSRSEDLTDRRPSPTLSCTSSTSSSSSSSHKPPLGMASPGSWSRPVTSPYSLPCSSVHANPQKMQQSLKTSHIVLPAQSIPMYNVPEASNSKVAELRDSSSTAFSHFTQSSIQVVGHPSIIHCQEPPNHQQQLEHWSLQLQSLTGSTRYASINSFEQALEPGVATVVTHHEPPSRPRFHVHKSITAPTGASETYLATPTPTKLALFTEGMLPLIINLEKLPGDDGFAYLCLELDVPEFQVTPMLFKNSLPGFGLRLEATFPADTRSSLTTCRCMTQVWGVSSSAQTNDTIKQEPLTSFHHTLSQEASVPRIPHAMSHRYGVGLSCLRREEAVVALRDVSMEQTLSRTPETKLMLLNFPESALSSCQLLDPGATIIHQELSFAGQAILRITYNLIRHTQLPSARLLGWERLPTLTSVAASTLQWSNGSCMRSDTELSEHRCSMEYLYSSPSPPRGPCF